MKTGSNRLLAFDYANFGINYFHYFPISIKNKGVNSRQINKTITKTVIPITRVAQTRFPFRGQSDSNDDKP
ncbi:hypothetical protein FCV54_03130 [Vibrio sp. F12]|nr:hypothetical protein FCV54_03130 [Vibrio sp. F12]